MSSLTNVHTGLASSKLAVVLRRLDSLRLQTKNPRLHSKQQIKQIARSISAFGFNVPVLIDKAGQVVAGHGRVLACRELGWTEVPTICLDHLNAAELQAFTIADNRLSETSTWDDRLLGEALRSLSLLKLDFSLEATGFDMGEIDLRIEGVEVVDETHGGDVADTLPETAPGPAVSHRGDVWLLGRHRLICGSALDPAAYDALMKDDVASMVFTDPPYNVPIQGHVSGLGRTQHREFAMASGEMSQAAFTTFLADTMALLARHSTDGSLHLICMDWRHMRELTEAAGPVYTELKNLCIWAKDNAGMGSLYRSQHELVFVYKRGTGAHRNNIELGRHGRNRTNVWRYPGVNSFGRRSEEGNLLALHPTVKPVQLVADAILDCTARGDVVLDVFLGSGTTLIAAERVGRRCYGLELDPVYVDTAIRRWQVWTGDVARHATSGDTFSERATASATAWNGEGAL